LPFPTVVKTLQNTRVRYSFIMLFCLNIRLLALVCNVACQLLFNKCNGWRCLY